MSDTPRSSSHVVSTDRSRDKLQHDGCFQIGRFRAHTSDGVVLSQFFEQERAPFFLVKDANSTEPEEWKAIYSYGQWKKLVTAV